MIKRTILALTAMAVSLLAQTSTFPTAVATDADLKVQVNGTQTTLTASLSAVATSTTVSNCTHIGPNMLATINTEIIAIANCIGTTLTFATTSPGCTNGRACDNSTAAAHASGANVSLFADAWHHNALRVQVEAIQTALYSGSSPTFANITSSGNVNGKAFNLYDNTGQTTNYGHFGMDAQVALLTKQLYIRDTAGASMLIFDPVNGSTTSLLNVNVGTNVTGKNLQVYGTVTTTGTVSSSRTTAGSAISGTTTYADPAAYGVFGSSTSGSGVWGVSTAGNGVRGISTDYYGVYGTTTTGIGVQGSSVSGTGMVATSTTGIGLAVSRDSGGYALTVTTTTGGGGIGVIAANSTVINGTTTSATSAVLTDSGGTCQIHGASGIACVSDGRLKKDVRPVSSSLAGVLRLKPVEYNMKSDGQHAVGLIAQDVRKQFPQAVQETEDGKLTLSYQQLFPYLLKAVQEQQAEINKLKARK
jgi:hypothetical protein